MHFATPQWGRRKAKLLCCGDYGGNAVCAAAEVAAALQCSSRYLQLRHALRARCPACR